MFHVGIDISKFKHDCFIATDAGVKVHSFTFPNTIEGFQLFVNELHRLGDPNHIKIGLESTGHYGINLMSFLSKQGFTYLEINPYLTSQFSKALSLRRTKTDKIDAMLIASLLGYVDYETLHTQFYHKNELKELVRARNAYVDARSREKVKLTNHLDKSFPEFKSFFNNDFSKTSLYILKTYKTKDKIANLTKSHFETLYRRSRGKLSYARFSKLKRIAQMSIGVSGAHYDFLIRTAINQIEQLDLLIDEIDKEITRLFNQTDSMLLTIPGLGVVQAASIYAEIGDINAFSTPGKLTAFAGLDVSINQSGTKEHYGKLVKRGSPLLRKVIWNYAFTSLRFIPPFYDFYQKKRNQDKHHKVALAHLSRKILRMIYHIEYNKVPFDINKLL